MNRVVTKFAASVDTWRSSDRLGIHAVGAVEAKVALTHRNIPMELIYRLLPTDQFLGLSTSPGENASWPLSSRVIALFSPASVLCSVGDGRARIASRKRLRKDMLSSRRWLPKSSRRQTLEAVGRLIRTPTLVIHSRTKEGLACL